jgi:hypothetical protein
MVDAFGSPALASPGAHYRCFLALMVGALGSSASTPLRGPPLMFLSVDGGRSWITSSGTFRGGGTIDVSYIDDERSRITNSGTSQGASRRCFLR